MSRTRQPLTADCPSCGSPGAIRIEITLPDDTDVTFTSCHECEHRWWESGAQVLDLTAVLEKARRA